MHDMGIYYYHEIICGGVTLWLDMLYESVWKATITLVTVHYYSDIFKQLTWLLTLKLKTSQQYKTHNMKIKIKSQSFFKHTNKNGK